MGMNRVVELWDQIPAWFCGDCLEILNMQQFFGYGPVLAGTWNCCRKKSGKVKEEVEKGRNLAQSKRRGAVQGGI